MNQSNIDSYRKIIGTNEVEEIKMLASMLEGRRLHNVNATFEGGGVAEILTRLVPLLNSLGLRVSWDIIKGETNFFEVTKAFHNALHGADTEITDEMFHIFNRYTQMNLDLFDKEADYYIIHDPQPVGLVRKRREFPGSMWAWRCHIDVSSPNKQVWDFLNNDVEKYDASIFTMPQFSRELSIPQILITPSIDPLSDKNRDLDHKTIEKTLDKFGIDPGRPLISQISRFDRLKDPLGVIQAYKLVRKRMDCQLCLAGGGASDDPEGQAVLREVREAANGDPDIKILELPPFSDIDINALQRASAVVLQKSLKEGFGMTVTEALWKGRPVIGGAVGGIKAQVINGVTGYLVHSIEGCAKRIEDLLRDPGKGDWMGASGRELVRSNYLLTRHIKNYLLLMIFMNRDLHRTFSEKFALAPRK